MNHIVRIVSTHMLTLSILALVVLLPQHLFAADIIPCGTNANNKECQYADLIQLFKNVINFFIRVIVPLVVIVGMLYIGFQTLTQSSKADALTRLKEASWKLAVGVFLMLSAGLIVKFLLDSLGVNGYVNFAK